MDDLSKKYVGKFIGKDQIRGIAVLAQTTPAGSAVFEIDLGDGAGKTRLPEKALVLSVTDAPENNYAEGLSARINAIAPIIIEAAEEYDLKFYEVRALGDAVVSQLTLRFHRAQNFLWTGNDKNFIPGFDPMNDQSILDAERVISSIPKLEEVKPDDAGE